MPQNQDDSLMKALLARTEKAVYNATGEHLNDLQRTILQELWQDPKKTYGEIAVKHNYSGNYIQQVAAPRLWRLLSDVVGYKVTKSNIRGVLEEKLVSRPNINLASAAPSLPPIAKAPIEYPSGGVPLNSLFYVQRPQEALCCHSILQPNAFIQIKAPRQMGKSSLLLRILAHASAAGIPTVTLNFQQAERSILSDLDKLLRWVCTCISQKLSLSPQLAAYWDADMGAKMSCTHYLEAYVLMVLSTPVVIAFEEISELFAYPTIVQEFFTLLRTWHEQAKTDALWQKMHLIMVQSTENYLYLDGNLSPLHVGIEVTLAPFDRAQVEALIDRHELTLEAAQIDQLMDLVQGHPYLTRWTLYHLSQSQVSFDEVMVNAATDMGIYHDHLERHLYHLQQYPELGAALQRVIYTDVPIELEQSLAFKLQSMGLVKLCGNQVTIACELYRQYFRDR
jgi:hypothetical protein